MMNTKSCGHSEPFCITKVTTSFIFATLTNTSDSQSQSMSVRIFCFIDSFAHSIFC